MENSLPKPKIPKGLKRAFFTNDVQQFELIIKRNKSLVHSVGAIPPIDGKLPIMAHAIFHARRDFVEVLLNNGVDVNSKLDEGRTPLAFLTSSKYNKHYDRTNLMRLLLDRGADVNLADESGHTPLLYAAIKKNEEQVKLLIGAGAELDVFSDIPYGYPELIGFDFAHQFLYQNPPPNTKPYYVTIAKEACVPQRLLTPLMYAVIFDEKNITKALVDAGAVFSEEQKSILIKKFLPKVNLYNTLLSLHITGIHTTVEKFLQVLEGKERPALFDFTEQKNFVQLYECAQARTNNEKSRNQLKRFILNMIESESEERRDNEGEKNFLENLAVALSTFSLQGLCRETIRKSIIQAQFANCHIKEEVIISLPLPEKVKSFLEYAELYPLSPNVSEQKV